MARQRTVMQWQGTDGATSIEFDAVEVEAPEHEVEITQYPIQGGADLTDHIRPKAPTLKLTCTISNSPSRPGLTQLDGAIPATQQAIRIREPLIPGANQYQLPTSVAGQPLTRETTIIATVRTWSDAGARVQRVQNIYQLLVNSMNSARAWTVVTDLFGDFDDMLIKSVRPTRDKPGNGIKIEILLWRIYYAELVRRDVSSFFNNKKKLPKVDTSKKDEGKKDPADADQQSESWLYGIWGGDRAMKFVPTPQTGSRHSVMRCALGGSTYQIEWMWNDRYGAWFFTMYTPDGDRLVSGVPVVLNVDLLAWVVPSLDRPPYPIYVADPSGGLDQPGLNDLGMRVKVVYAEPSS